MRIRRCDQLTVSVLREDWSAFCSNISCHVLPLYIAITVGGPKNQSLTRQTTGNDCKMAFSTHVVREL